MAASFVQIAVPAVQGALFAEKNDLKIKVYGQEKPVVMSGSLQAADKKEGDKYVPTAYGRLGIKAVKASTKDGKEYLQLVIDGGLSGRLFKAEGKDYDYAGAIDTGDGHEFAIFGRKRKSEAGNSFIALSSGERRAKEAHSNGEHAAVAATADDDEIPF